MLAITEGLFSTKKGVTPLDNSLFRYAVPWITGAYVGRALWNGGEGLHIIPSLGLGFGANLVTRYGIDTLNDYLERRKRRVKSTA